MTTQQQRPVRSAWDGFRGGLWRDEINVRDFIQQNYTPYEGDNSFLAGPTERTTTVWKKITDLFPEERAKGVLDVSYDVPSTITAHPPGFIDQDTELIVGLQTDAPLKRAIMPFGGWRMVAGALQTYGYPVSPELEKVFTQYRKTHNAGVFDAYTPQIRAARKAGIVTGLPDAYGRGRIIGDYRRVPLYGVDRLIEAKQEEKADLDALPRDPARLEEVIREREEISEQIRALGELKEMAASYGSDVSGPASTGREAVQWLYFAYLAAVKEQNGAAMSLGRTSTFLDAYLQRDIDAGILDESAVQEIVDDFIIKLRIVRFLRTPEYDELFSGDPTWVTESIGGIGSDGRTLVTRTSFRYLQTLYNLGPAPEPNMTVFWSPALPQGFKEFCAQASIDTSSLQYESDELMRPRFGDDTAIACCVSAMEVGKQMQFFGARVNLAKTLLYAINGGRDELSGAQVGPATGPVTGETLDYDEVLGRLDRQMEWLAETYVHALNVIHYMHDRYAYERLEMALHDRDIRRTMACGIAGLSVAADSLSAIKYAQVAPVRDEAASPSAGANRCSSRTSPARSWGAATTTWACTPPWTPPASSAPAPPTPFWTASTWCSWTSSPGTASSTCASPAVSWNRPWSSPVAWPHWARRSGSASSWSGSDRPPGERGGRRRLHGVPGQRHPCRHPALPQVRRRQMGGTGHELHPRRDPGTERRPDRRSPLRLRLVRPERGMTR